MDPRPIMALIRQTEIGNAEVAQGVASDYDVVWGGIAKKDRPPKPLTQMTVAEVLAWQDRIDSRYNSEAAGAYQILEDTLRGLSVRPNMRFDVAGQDHCCMLLLRRRGWDRLESKGAAWFGDQLAREWASLPVHSDQKGASRPVKRGQSYYAGDGLNKAHVAPETVLAAIHAATADPPAAGFADLTDAELRAIANAAAWMAHPDAAAAVRWMAARPEEIG